MCAHMAKAVRNAAAFGNQGVAIAAFGLWSLATDFLSRVANAHSFSKLVL